MKLKLILLLSIVVLLSFAAALVLHGNDKSNTQSMNKTLPVTASFYPMAEFVKQVGGSNVTVDTLVTPGVEPHDYEPSPKDLVKLRKSPLLVYNGAGLEPWLDKITAELPKNFVTLVNTSQNVSLINNDPHIWLDPVFAQQQVQNIKNALIASDPKNEEAYRTNADAYISKLSALDKEFQSGLAQCESRTIVTSHQAFKYLAQRYDIDIKSIAGLSPEEEPSPQKLAEVAEFAKANNVRYIFFETLASPKLSQTIAREIGAKTLVLNPLEGLTDAEVAANADYLSVQRENLTNLRLAMGCM